MADLPTIRQLAAQAGVSRTTVSLALRNHPSISPSTRERIQRVAREEGYRIDPLVATLMTQLRTGRRKRSVEKLAYLTSWPTRDEWLSVSANDRRFFEGVRARADRLGYEVEHIWAKEPGMTAARLSKILYTRAIRGLILAPMLQAHGHASLDWQYFAASTISYTVSKPALHRTTHSHYTGMLLTLRNLKRHGYRRIGLTCLTDQDERVNHAWQAAYLIHYHSLPLPQRIPPFFAASAQGIHPGKAFARKKGEFRKWIEQHRPDVVVSNLTAPLDLLREMGRDVPGEIGYACLDLPDESAVLSGVDQLASEVGAAAVDLVVTQLQNNEFGLPTCPKTVQIDGLWRDGATTRFPAARPPAARKRRPAKR